MTGSLSKILVLIFAALISAASLCVLSADEQDDPSTTRSARQKGMNENLEDANPQSERDAEQALENPRIVVPENLGEMPQVYVLTGEETDNRDSSDGGDESLKEET